MLLLSTLLTACSGDVKSLAGPNSNRPTANSISRWVVRVDGPGDTPTIQDALAQSLSGDTILVDPGLYYENLVFPAHDVVLISTHGYDSTTIDGSRGVGSVMSITQGSHWGTLIEGFTITSGQVSTTTRAGAGIYCKNGSPTIRNNHFFRNIAAGVETYSSGGGLRLDSDYNLSPAPMPIVEANRFEENEALSNGGALEVEQNTRAVIRGNSFVRNRAAHDGGAIRANGRTDGGTTIQIVGNSFVENVCGDHGGAIEAGNSHINIDGNLFAQNSASGFDGPGANGVGGAVSARAFSGTIRNNTFYENTGTGENSCEGGAILLESVTETIVSNNLIIGSMGCGIACRGNSAAVVEKNIIWQNTPMSIQTPPGCSLFFSGNIEADPLFCDASSGDFHVSPDSPAIVGGVAWGAFPDPGCTSHIANRVMSTGAVGCRLPGPAWFSHR